MFKIRKLNVNFLVTSVVPEKFKYLKYVHNVILKEDLQMWHNPPKYVQDPVVGILGCLSEFFI